MSEESLKKFYEIAKKRTELMNKFFSDAKMKWKEVKPLLKDFDEQLDALRDE